MAETPLERRLIRTWWAPAARLFARDSLFWLAALFSVMLLGAGLRFHGLEWDRPDGAEAPLQMHPDERFLSLVSDHLRWPASFDEYFDTANSPLNPYNDPDTHSYVYGTFPLFLAKGVSAIAGDDGYDGTVVWGRRLTAMFDIATIAGVFALGSVLLGRRAGLLGAFLYALAVLPTQLAHFWTMDPYVTFFGVLTLLLSALVVTERRPPALVGLCVALGAAVGLGLASKVTAWPLALGPAIAIAARIGLRDIGRLGLRWRGSAPQIGGHWMTDVSLLCLSMIVGMVAFRIAQPYAFSGPHFWDMSFNPRWRADIEREINFQNGNVDFPPFIQFAGRTPFVAPLQNLLVWGLGPGIGLIGLAGFLVAGVLLFRRRELAFALPLCFALAIFLFQGPRFVAFMRYFVPIYPVLCLFAGWALVWLIEAARASRASPAGWRFPPGAWVARRIGPGARPFRYSAATVAALSLAAAAWWAMAFQAVYTNGHPRLEASDWIYRHVPPGSAITGEIWDDTLPYPLPGAPVGAYRLIELEPYLTDSEEKVYRLVYGSAERPGLRGGLNAADYVALASNLIRDSVQRLEREYPATIRYYQLLESGELGFEKVAAFSSHPTFLGISIDDSSAEASFTLFDHPEVTLYRKTDRWDAAKAVRLLEEAHPERAVNLLPKQGKTNGLQFTAAAAAVQQDGGSFSDVFDAGAWPSALPWLWWLVWMELAAFAAMPWVTWLFRPLPDRGYGLSKLAGFAAVVLPVWLLVAWGGPPFSATLVWSVFGGALGVGLGLGILRRDALRRDLRERWPSWVVMECVFLGAFFAFLALRAYNPDLWYHPQGGEKPIELAYLTAIARTTELPPYDPWFAGGTMNYYYMGWFFLAVPIRALKILPEVAFNLGIPTFGALSAVVAVSTVHNLVALAGVVRRKFPLGAPRRSLRPAIAAGLLGGVLLVGVGNLDGAHQMIERLQAVNQWGAFEGIPVIGGAAGIAGGLWQWLILGDPLPPFDWWRSSRVHFGQFDITEFPYWSLLFGDLHPHLMGVPFFGLTIALALTYVVAVRDGLRGHAWGLAAALGIALGLVRTVHTWDFPTAVLIMGTAVVTGQLLAKGRWQQRWWDGAGHLALAGAVLAVVFAPYTTHFETFNTGVMRAPQTTDPRAYFSHLGLFFCVALAFIALRYHEELRARDYAVGHNPVMAAVAGTLERLALGVFLVGLSAFTWNYGLTVIALTAVVLVFLFNLAWLELRAGTPNLPRLFVTLLFLLAFGIAGGVDVVTFNNDIVRMNTVFKFLLQSWQLFALASAFATWYIARALWEADGIRVRPAASRRAAAWGAAGVAALLLFGASIYLVSGTRARQEARFAQLAPTLDGLAYLKYGQYVEDLNTPEPYDDVQINLRDDVPLIRWLRENVHGSPVISEAVGPLYHWTGRMSVNTGLPAVIGWDWHEVAYRTDYAYLVQERRGDTNRFYNDASVEFASSYLRKYNVSYVVVGTEEYAYGSPAGILKFGRMPELQEVFRSGNYVIYRVDPVLAPRPTPVPPAPASPAPRPG